MIGLKMRWRDILFLHREVDPATLDLPEGLEPDLFEGHAYLGHVPFRMEGVRPAGCPEISRLSDFPETNLRTYVRLDGVPFVWFFSLETPNRTANTLARRFFGLPYLDAPVAVVRAANEVRYSGGRNAPAEGLLARVGPICEQSEFDRWAVDRYNFVASHRGAWREGVVSHAPYVLREVTVDRMPDWPLARFCDGVDVDAAPIRLLRSQ